jgi:hypothetical protein
MAGRVPVHALRSRQNFLNETANTGATDERACCLLFPQLFDVFFFFFKPRSNNNRCGSTFTADDREAHVTVEQTKPKGSHFLRHLRFYFCLQSAGADALVCSVLDASSLRPQPLDDLGQRSSEPWMHMHYCNPFVDVCRKVQNSSWLVRCGLTFVPPFRKQVHAVSFLLYPFWSLAASCCPITTTSYTSAFFFGRETVQRE